MNCLLMKYGSFLLCHFPVIKIIFFRIPHCLYETFVMDMKGVSKRSAFVIGKDGRVQYAEVLEHAGEEPGYEAIEKCLAALN